MIYNKIEKNTIQNLPENSFLQVNGNAIFVFKRNRKTDPLTGKIQYIKVYTGRIINNIYYTMEEFHNKFKKNGKPRVIKVPQINNDQNNDNNRINTGAERNIGSTFLFAAASEVTFLAEDLSSTFSSEISDIILSNAFFLLEEKENSYYRYVDYSEGKCLPFNGSISPKEQSEFLYSLGRSLITDGKLDIFFAKRWKKISEKIGYLDGTYIPTESNLKTTDKGKSKQGIIESQIGLNLLVEGNSELPMMFNIVPGNLHDINNFIYLLDRVQYYSKEYLSNNKDVMIVDKGYFSETILDEVLYKKANIIVACKIDIEWIKEAILKNKNSLLNCSNYIEGTSCYGITVEIERNFKKSKRRKVYVSIYLNTELREHKKFEFLKKLCILKRNIEMGNEKCVNDPFYDFLSVNTNDNGLVTAEFKNDKIDEYCEYFGYFTNISTYKISADDAYLLYKGRDIVEKTYKYGKSDLKIGCVRAHSDFTIMGRMFISFIALIIMCEIKKRMRINEIKKYKNGKIDIKKSVSEDFSWNKLLDKFKNTHIYEINNTLELSKFSKVQINILHRLGFLGYSSALPIYAKKSFVSS